MKNAKILVKSGKHAHRLGRIIDGGRSHKARGKTWYMAKLGDGQIVFVTAKQIEVL